MITAVVANLATHTDAAFREPAAREAAVCVFEVGIAKRAP